MNKWIQVFSLSDVHRIITKDPDSSVVNSYITLPYCILKSRWKLVRKGSEIYSWRRDSLLTALCLSHPPFLSLMRLSSVPLQRDSGLNSMLPSFSTAATSSSTDCTSSSMKPTICMAFWEGKKERSHRSADVVESYQETWTRCQWLCQQTNNIIPAACQHCN